jgi:outer membrane receptor protein involved in Fe transport
LAFAAGTVPALAQAASDGTSETMETVLVTASKLGAQSLQATPLAIQAFSGETLKVKNVVDVDTLMSSIPGAAPGQDNNVATRSYTIRGVGATTSTNGDSPIGYYLDDVPFNVPNFGIAPPIRFLDIDRVEVLRGPQGTLYGQGSAGDLPFAQAGPERLSDRRRLYVVEYGGRARYELRCIGVCFDPAGR